MEQIFNHSKEKGRVLEDKDFYVWVYTQASILFSNKSYKEPNKIHQRKLLKNKQGVYFKYDNKKIYLPPAKGIN